MSDNVTSDAAVDARWREMAERALKRSAIERALDAAGVIADDRDLVVGRMARFVALTERDGELVATATDDTGEVRLGSRSLPVSVDALAMEFREKYPRNFRKPETMAPIAATAAPAGSAWSGPNPFAAESRNLTEQGRLYRADPSLYARWRAESEGLPVPTTPSGSAALSGDPMRFFRRGSTDWSLTRQGEIFRTDRALHDRLKAASEAA